MRTPRITPLLFTVPLALAALTGCGGGGGGGSQSVTTQTLSASAKTPEGLTATLTEASGGIPPGGSLTYTLTLTNNTTGPITYETQTGCGIDAGRVGAGLTVTGPSGATDYPTGATCTEIGLSASATLAPGQSVSDTFQPTGAFSGKGVYQATASFGTQAPGQSALSHTKVGPLTVLVEPIPG